jgi:hypothetical protein
MPTLKSFPSTPTGDPHITSMLPITGGIAAIPGNVVSVEYLTQQVIITASPNPGRLVSNQEGSLKTKLLDPLQGNIARNAPAANSQARAGRR